MKKRSGPIKNKVFTMQDLSRIAKLIIGFKEQISSEIKDERDAKQTRLICIIECDDNTTIENDDFNVFIEDEMNGFSRVVSIDIKLRNHRSDHYIWLALDSEKGYGKLTVESKDRDWADAKYTQLMHAIELVKKQENWYTRNQRLIFHLASISLGIIPYFVVLSIAGLFISPIENPNEKVLAVKTFFSENSWVIYILTLLAWWSLGNLWAILLTRWVSKLWPSIEFDFGPEHLNLTKARRTRLGLASTLVIIPLLLAIFYDGIKKLIF